jgi:hypothetical protein
MATRKAAKRRTSKRKPARSTRRARPNGRSVNEILMDLGRQMLTEGVKEVLADHGVDPSVKVEMVLTKPKARRPARKPAKRRR